MGSGGTAQHVVMHRGENLILSRATRAAHPVQRAAPGSGPGRGDDGSVCRPGRARCRGAGDRDRRLARPRARFQQTGAGALFRDAGRSGCRDTAVAARGAAAMVGARTERPAQDAPADLAARLPGDQHGRGVARRAGKALCGCIPADRTGGDVWMPPSWALACRAPHCRGHDETVAILTARRSRSGLCSRSCRLRSRLLPRPRRRRLALRRTALALQRQRLDPDGRRPGAVAARSAGCTISAPASSESAANTSDSADIALGIRLIHRLGQYRQPERQVDLLRRCAFGSGELPAIQGLHRFDYQVEAPAWPARSAAS